MAKFEMFVLLTLMCNSGFLYTGENICFLPRKNYLYLFLISGETFDAHRLKSSQISFSYNIDDVEGEIVVDSLLYHMDSSGQNWRFSA